MSANLLALHRRSANKREIIPPKSAPTPRPSSDKGYWERFWKCMNERRLDNTLRDVGKSIGFPSAGEFVADMTVTAGVYSLLNNGLNLAFGRYPRASARGPAGSPSSYQHRLYSRSGPIGSRLESSARTTLADAGKATGRFLYKASAVTLAFEGGYVAGSAISCSDIARQ